MLRAPTRSQHLIWSSILALNYVSFCILCAFWTCNCNKLSWKILCPTILLERYLYHSIISSRVQAIWLVWLKYLFMCGTKFESSFMPLHIVTTVVLWAKLLCQRGRIVTEWMARHRFASNCLSAIRIFNEFLADYFGTVS